MGDATGVGVDNEAGVLDWGRRQNFDGIDAARYVLLDASVLDEPLKQHGRFDAIVAMNHSYNDYDIISPFPSRAFSFRQHPHSPAPAWCDLHWAARCFVLIGASDPGLKVQLLR